MVHWMRYVKIILFLMLFMALLAVFIYWLGFSSQVPIDSKHRKIDSKSLMIIKPNITTVPDYYAAVGTVRPSTESKLEAQIMAKILAIKVAPGDKVSKGQKLIILDSRDYQSRVERAKEAVNAAKAVMDQNKATFKRIERLVEPGYVSKLQFDQTKSDYLSSIAKLRQAEKAFNEAQVALSYCVIKAPEDGIVLDKFVDVGDQAVPGKVLLKLQTASVLQLWATVPEELINKLRITQQLNVHIDAIKKRFIGKIGEIVPNIDPKTRTFTVKVNLSQDLQLYPGMFGRVLIPVSQQEVITIPQQVVMEQGQLTMVNILVNGEIQRIIITTGKKHGELIEVLSGLTGDESIVRAKP